jgi:hypothetical protein
MTKNNACVDSVTPAPGFRRKVKWKTYKNQGGVVQKTTEVCQQFVLADIVKLSCRWMTCLEKYQPRATFTHSASGGLNSERSD